MILKSSWFFTEYLTVVYCTEVSFHNLSEKGKIKALQLGYSPAISKYFGKSYEEVENGLVCHLD